VSLLHVAYGKALSFTEESLLHVACGKALSFTIFHPLFFLSDRPLFFLSSPTKCTAGNKGSTVQEDIPASGNKGCGQQRFLSPRGPLPSSRGRTCVPRYPSSPTVCMRSATITSPTHHHPHNANTITHTHTTNTHTRSHAYTTAQPPVLHSGDSNPIWRSPRTVRQNIHDQPGSTSRMPTLLPHVLCFAP
jgi:hypothetical protein